MTAYGTIATAVEAMRSGAYDFVSKPLKRAEVVGTVRKALERRALLVENRALRAELEATRRPSLVGNSQVFRSTVEVAEQGAASSATILLMGESGTGKELLARLVHERSPRASGPFVATNCAALPRASWSRSCLATRRGPSPARSRAARAALSRPTGARSSSTRSGSSPWPCRSSSCARSRRRDRARWWHAAQGRLPARLRHQPQPRRGREGGAV